MYIIPLLRNVSRVVLSYLDLGKDEKPQNIVPVCPHGVLGFLFSV